MRILLSIGLFCSTQSLSPQSFKLSRRQFSSRPWNKVRNPVKPGSTPQHTLIPVSPVIECDSQTGFHLSF